MSNALRLPWDLLLDGNNHLRVGPAALKAPAAVAGPIVRHHPQNVFARIGKRRRGCRLPVKHRPRRPWELRGVRWRPVIREHYGTRSSKLTPEQRDRRCFRARRAGNYARIVRDPQRKRNRVPYRRRQRLTVPPRAVDKRTSLFKTDPRWRIPVRI